MYTIPLAWGSHSPETISQALNGYKGLHLVKRVLGIILGGGAGTRLYPLTKKRAKPAVPLAGKYRLIDIPVSNCINSEIYKIYVLTQFNSASLNRHISRTYNASGLGANDSFVEVLAAQQTPENPNWFQGTADAVRQYIWMLQEWDVDEFVILSGDHLYRMDYRKFVERHRETGADITLSVVPMDDKRASDFGLMKIDPTGRVIDFCEKPTGDELKAMQVDTTILGLSPEAAKESPYIASMGIYVFKKEALIKLLHQNPDFTDFGKEIIPNAAKENNIQAYLFSGYWEDIGTIESFYDANLALTNPNPPFSFYDDNAPIYTRHRFLPPSNFLDTTITQSIIGEGCMLKKCRIHHSVLGVRSLVKEGCVIEDTLIMGADFYQTQAEMTRDSSNGAYVPVGIGQNTTIRRAIIDKNAHIGRDVQIINKDRIEDSDREHMGFIIRNGIVVVVKNAVIPDGTII